ncbi:hypothetical protein VE01_04119 [Pseudogymnoascus verrucosus]|uniref:FAD-binding domain-containing protein n=1 Tax=Pseudogymnoascus verrucosus TaxID=342668 RepID=A0A1B8GLM7_9PEZI|nr:uncharacterized protein VE01_04119 [Pseudogymnoascus verrucosus]OBT96732.2 hypothetical protein VE01_04119 [Pseudogymnoascus verrucosus]
MPPQRATVIGLGLSGALLALSLNRYSSTIPTIYELRASPSTLGGAINLTPPVSRILDSLGLLAAAKEIAFETKEISIFSLRSGAKLGALPFIDEETGHTSLRIERALLLELLIRALDEAGVQVVFGKRLEGVREVEDGRVAAVFADGGEVESELLFGCDGIHSLVRGAYVEPDRKATYSGLSSAYGFSATPEGLIGKEGFEGTAVASGMRGSVIVSYCGPRKEKVFVGAVMEVKAPDADRDGWRGKGAMGTEAKKELVERFGGGDPVFKAVVEGVEEWSFFPVWVLPNGGTYWRGRTVLVGDAAHAGPPGGEGAALAMEDAVVLGRLVGKAEEEGAAVEAVFRRYDELRRERVTENYTRASARWEGAKNRSWLFQKTMELFMWAFLMVWWNKREWGFEYDAANVELGGKL